jgi:hypothetical protein
LTSGGSKPKSMTTSSNDVLPARQLKTTPEPHRSSVNIPIRAMQKHGAHEKITSTSDFVK